jgi:hypothetical protein
MRSLLIAASLLALILPASAHVHRSHHYLPLHHYAHRGPSHLYSDTAHSGGGNLVTVPTAAGIPITVASYDASKFVGFISDLVAQGFRPRHIGCFASGGHVRNSNHYHGGACDIDQTARNRAPGFMYHVAELAARWGLRDGCTFHDCGHIDDGANVGGPSRWAQVRAGRRYASARRSYAYAGHRRHA